MSEDSRLLERLQLVLSALERIPNFFNSWDNIGLAFNIATIAYPKRYNHV